MQFSEVTVLLSVPRLKYYPQHFVFKNLNYILPSVRNQIFPLYKATRKIIVLCVLF
jgi:hypothetical protein